MKSNGAGRGKSAGTKSKKVKKFSSCKSSKSVSEKRNKSVYTVVLFSVSVLLFFITMVKGENLWLIIHNFILGLFGVCSFFLPLLLLYVAVSEARGNETSNIKYKIIITCFSIILFCSSVYVFKTSNIVKDEAILDKIKTLYDLGIKNKSAGIFSGVIGIPLVWLCGKSGAEIVNVILIFLSLMLFTGTDLITFFRLIKKPVLFIKDKVSSTISKRRENKISDNLNVSSSGELEGGKFNKDKFSKDVIWEENSKIAFNTEKNICKDDGDFTDNECKFDASEEKNNLSSDADDSEYSEITENNVSQSDYNPPPVELLSASGETDKNDVVSERHKTGQILVETLESFNVKTNIVNISRGPSVTRYELQPAAGVKISKITNLADDIALNLAASGVRIEAPIPGKSAVGIEVPNKVVSVVRMRELISSQIFMKSESNLTVVLGRDISGKITVADLSKMPHLLIAGSTGSGKSVCINSFIISLIYKSTPEDVRLLMVDPKVVELGVYNGIPHLLVPVVTDPRKAAKVLNWAVKQMLDRYKMFAENNVRDLKSYNSYVRSHDGLTDKEGNALKPLPQIVIIIDELADLMMVAPNEVEDAICRLAQMARAAGMHLVIATQRPSVDVITGIIKANIPSRIALAVSSQVDSRTIIDSSGAEKLLGRGDMLFLPIGENKPIRVQGCYVSDSEIENIVEFIKKSAKNSEYDEKVIDEIENSVALEADKEETSSSSEDPLMNNAIKCVVEAGQASTSLLQRRLKLGYARAGRLIDEMEQKGIVGPHEGSKPRKVLITYQQYLEMNMNKCE